MWRCAPGVGVELVLGSEVRARGEDDELARGGGEGGGVGEGLQGGEEGEDGVGGVGVDVEGEGPEERGGGGVGVGEASS